MKAFKILAVFFLSLVIIAGCNRGNDNVNPDDLTINSVSELVVPADFDWKTTQTLAVSVELPATGEIQPLIITDRNGTVRYFRGYPEDGSRTINTVITIPAYVFELKLTYNGTTGPNIVFVSNGELYYNFNKTTKSVKSDDEDCDLSGFETFSKGGWGTEAHGNNPGTLRDQHFDQVYPGDFVIGDPDHYTVTFESSTKVKNYLPGGGDPKLLTQDWLNPVKSNHLGNMADQIIAARLNRDFSEAGFLGTNENFKLGDLVFADGPFVNISVDEFLAMAEIALGGGGMNGFTIDQYKSAAENINLSFENNEEDDHDKSGGDDEEEDILTCPADSNSEEPFIVLSAECSDPDVIFTLTNTGDGDMSVAKAYTLYKNNTQINNGNYQLDVNETLDITTSGLNTDEFKLVVVKPDGTTMEEIITGCGDEEDDDDNTSEQLAGTLAYEDLWPGKGDYDFNDLIIDYDFVINKNSQEVVQNMTATFVVKAFGASYHNGFGFTLPAVSPNDIVSVSGTDVVNNTVFTIAGNGLEAGQSKATVIVFDDARRVMPQTTAGIGVNTQLAYAYIEPVTVVVNIVFANNAITYSELNIGTFNPFIIVNTTINDAPGVRGLEVHLPNYEPSDLFDESYIGQLDDDSSISDGRYFVTAQNHPWAINIANGFDWVIEFQDITGAYNMFAEWAQSGGINYPDWYLDNNGYRNDNLIYPTQIVP
jgi:LruC domain-containing protein